MLCANGLGSLCAAGKTQLHVYSAICSAVSPASKPLRAALEREVLRRLEVVGSLGPFPYDWSVGRAAVGMADDGSWSGSSNDEEQRLSGNWKAAQCCHPLQLRHESKILAGTTSQGTAATYQGFLVEDGPAAVRPVLQGPARSFATSRVSHTKR